MLDRVTLWVDVAATAADALLLARVLQLRLQRVYLYITLFCALTVFFDAVQLWFGIHSEESQRIFIYSRFLYVLLYPLAAWDVFEEIKPQVQQIRRLALGRLVTGLFFAALFGLLVSLVVSVDEGQSPVGATVALVLWAGSSVATLGFLWSLHRALRTQQTPMPNNTFVWLAFLQLILLAELVSCFGGMLAQFGGPTVVGVLDVSLLTYGLAITVWCTAKLKRTPSGVPTPASPGTA